MADISLDVPAAYLVLERWVIRCRQVRSVILPPGSEFFHPGSRVIKIPDPVSASASKNLNIFSPKNYLDVHH